MNKVVILIGVMIFLVVSIILIVPKQETDIDEYVTYTSDIGLGKELFRDIDYYGDYKSVEIVKTKLLYPLSNAISLQLYLEYDSDNYERVVNNINEDYDFIDSVECFDEDKCFDFSVQYNGYIIFKLDSEETTIYNVGFIGFNDSQNKITIMVYDNEYLDFYTFESTLDGIKENFFN